MQRHLVVVPCQHGQKNPIKAGASGKIDVKFNSRGKKNKQSKAITLTTNTAKGREFVKITGFVTPKEKK